MKLTNNQIDYIIKNKIPVIYSMYTEEKNSNTVYCLVIFETSKDNMLKGFLAERKHLNNEGIDVIKKRNDYDFTITIEYLRYMLSKLQTVKVEGFSSIEEFLLIAGK